MLAKVGATDEMWRAWLTLSKSPQYTTLTPSTKSLKARPFVLVAAQADLHIAWQIINMAEVEFKWLPLIFQRQLLSAPEWPTAEPEERAKLTARHLDITVGLENALNVKWNGEAYEGADRATSSTQVLYTTLAERGKLANVLLQYPDIKEALPRMTWLPASVLSYANLTDTELAAMVQENAPAADNASNPVTSDFVSLAGGSPERQEVRSDEASLSTAVSKALVSPTPDDGSSVLRMPQSGTPLNSNVQPTKEAPSQTTNESARTQRTVSTRRRLRMRQKSNLGKTRLRRLQIPYSRPRSSTQSRGGGHNTNKPKAATPASGEEGMDSHVLGF